MYESGRGLKKGDVKESKTCKYLPRGFGFGRFGTGNLCPTPFFLHII